MNATASRMCELVDNVYYGEWLALGAVGASCISIGWLLRFITSEVITSRRGHEDRK